MQWENPLIRLTLGPRWCSGLFKREINLDSDDQQLLSSHTLLSTSVPHQRLWGGSHFQHGRLSALNRSQVSHKICQGTVKEMNISFLQTHFLNIMVGMWFSGCHRDKHERGGLRYAAVLATLPAARRALVTMELHVALKLHSLHLPERKFWNLRLMY